jgi:hypothetical protein
MKRFGENVFQFSLTAGGVFMDFGIAFVPIGFSCLCILVSIGNINNSSGKIGTLIFWLLLFVLSIYWCKIFRRYLKSGVILDKNKGIISISRWTWNIKTSQKFEEIQISEILGVDRDVDVTTETKLVNAGRSNARWHTTETRIYNVVLQGKFGSRRFKLASPDDWNLFMTLLYNDE